MQHLAGIRRLLSRIMRFFVHHLFLHSSIMHIDAADADRSPSYSLYIAYLRVTTAAAGHSYDFNRFVINKSDG